MYVCVCVCLVGFFMTLQHIRMGTTYIIILIVDGQSSTSSQNV